MHFGSDKDLLSRLAYSLKDDEARPIAFLTGAGLSSPSVPGVAEILSQLRGVFPAEEQIELDSEVSRHLDFGEKYRAAFQFLADRRPSETSQRLIELITLFAYDKQGENKSSANLSKLEDDIAAWRLPSGQAALGRILTGLRPELRGPIMTTNFDPLTEIAVRRAGGSATTYVHVDDSSFLANHRVQSGVSVVHLHGNWRNSSVSNTLQELTVDRPTLTAALRVILQQHTLVVLGYGGWNDVFTRSLLAAISENRAEDLDVVWCVYSDRDKLEKSSDGAELLAKFGTAPASIKFYAGIDANIVLPQLEKRLASVLRYTDSPRKRAGGGALPGWSEISRDTLAEFRVRATSAAALKFYDGRLPSWSDAVSPFIPIREVSITIANKILEQEQSGLASLSLLTGPSGEGKSTIALQAAAQLISQDDADGNQLFKVLQLTSDYFGALEQITGLDAGLRYVLLVDEAHRFYNDIRVLVERINAVARTGLHLVIVSGDIDWQACGGANFAWQREISSKVYAIQGVDHVDASSMVAAWERMGPEALGHLATIPTTGERIEALLDFSFGEDVAGRGTLLGALLMTRYDRPGLRQHLRQLLDKLKVRHISSRHDFTLMDALVSIALPHAYGCVQLDSTVLSSALDISRVELISYVLYPLGEESAITYGSGRIVARHETIASTIVDICLEDGYDLESVVARLVRAAALEIRRGKHSSGLIELAYLSSKITDLPRLSLAGARAAVEVAPDRLSYRTSLSAALRKSAAASEAAEANSKSLRLIYDDSNRNQVRGYFTEWGVAEGILGNFARNSILAAVALQDTPRVGDLQRSSIQRAISCLLFALRRLCETSEVDELIPALASACVVARSLWEGRDKTWLRAAERVVDASGHAFPRADATEQLNVDLVAGLRIAFTMIESPFPVNFPRHEFSFERLIGFLGTSPRF